MSAPTAADARKRQIMDAAEQMFIARGYGATSIADILDAVGIAKGTFYHHFASKEAVMDAIIDRYTDLIQERATAVIAQEGASPQEQILGVILAARERPESQSDLLEELHQPENEIFHLRSQQRTTETMIPVLANIVRNGIDQGVFNTSYPVEAMEMILHYANAAFDESSITDPAERQRKVEAFVHHAELLLGAEPGSFAFLISLLSGNT